MAKSPPKDVALEALRGIAALVVVLWHLLLALFPRSSGVVAPIDAAQSLNGAFWFGPLHGTAAVIFFFVLSGFVLTYRPLVQQDPLAIARGAVKRWPRLAGPVLATVMLSWSLFLLGAYHYLEAGAIVQSEWLQDFAGGFKGQPYVPRFGDALVQGSFGTIFRGDNYYDCSLWTMRVEFIGSLIAFGLAMALHHLRASPLGLRFGLIGLVAVACSGAEQHLVAFPVGVAIALLFAEREVRLPLPAALAMLGAAVWLAGYTDGRGDFAWIKAMAGGQLDSAWPHMIGAALAVLAVRGTPAVAARLSGQWAEFLGRISFPVYLVHVLVLCSVGAWVVVALHPLLPEPWPALLGSAATIAVTIALSVNLAQADRWWTRQVNAAAARLLPRERVTQPAPAVVPANDVTLRRPARAAPALPRLRRTRRR